MEDILNGFLFAIGWFLARVVANIVVMFVDKTLYRIWPRYHNFCEKSKKRYPS